jgi:hypothetical protein
MIASCVDAVAYCKLHYSDCCFGHVGIVVAVVESVVDFVVDVAGIGEVVDEEDDVHSS